mmetsp:Transcript_23086/g.78637  ORF Transcript_23086/g.78637 Transcript_23086/m.78637 type:complete len:117 (-) Transcript_23086:72-422(-)
MSWFGRKKRDEPPPPSGGMLSDGSEAFQAQSAYAAQSTGSRETDAVIGQMRAELQAQYTQELIATIKEKCFALCITKPGSSLSSSERTCLNNCTDRYVDAIRVLTKTVMEEVGKQQ